MTTSSYAPCDHSNTYAGPGTIEASLLINYGNGSLRWYNQTTIPSTWNAYTMTTYLVNCNIQAQFYGPPLNEHLIRGINGVSDHGSFSWNLWVFCQNHNAWSYSEVGADETHVTNGQVLAWVYEVSSSGAAPEPPLANSNTISACP